MRVAVIGSGTVGKALATAAVPRGHAVVLAARDPAHAAEAAEATGATAARSSAEAVEGADVVVIAVPWASVPDVAADLGSHVDGVALVDATNPLLPDYSAIAVQEGSGAEEVQRLLPGASVVKAINTVLAGRIVDPVLDGVSLDGYVAGDDAAAKATVTESTAGPGSPGGSCSARPAELRPCLGVRHASATPGRSACPRPRPLPGRDGP
jgi:8-hydroxy-5-deazaflavin:NADPH oxidoreductase